MEKIKLLTISFFFLYRFQVWFKNRRAKFRKQKREENERLRKLQEDHLNNSSLKCHLNEAASSPNSNLSSGGILSHSLMHSYSDADDSSSDLEVAWSEIFTSTKLRRSSWTTWILPVKSHFGNCCPLIVCADRRMETRFYRICDPKRTNKTDKRILKLQFNKFIHNNCFINDWIWIFPFVFFCKY